MSKELDSKVKEILELYDDLVFAEMRGSRVREKSFKAHVGEKELAVLKDWYYRDAPINRAVAPLWKELQSNILIKPNHLFKQGLATDLILYWTVLVVTKYNTKETWYLDSTEWYK